MELLHDAVNWIVQVVGQWGYLGIIAMMFLESSFFPFPSEVVIIPAGYLASQGNMSMTLVIVSGILGSVAGALFNYWLAATWGRAFLEKFGRYALINLKTLNKADHFFADHGHISTFAGRLLPGVRQYVSLPAGIARMNLGLFSVFTTLGAGIWVLILALIGYFIGENQELINRYLKQVLFGVLGFIVIMVISYIVIRKHTIVFFI